MSTLDGYETKVFRGRNKAEVLRTIRAKHGSDVMIVSSKPHPRFDSIIEITVAVPRTPRAALSAAAAGDAYHRAEKATLSPFKSKLAEILGESGLAAAHWQSIVQQYVTHGADLQSINTQVLANILSSRIPLGIRDVPGRRIIAFTGPTGVGKTTTIAKLAGAAALDGSQTVGLITIDSHRIGGAEQLAKSVAPFDIPVYRALSAFELQERIDLLSYCDRIFIDTAGAGPWDTDRLDELSKILNCGRDIQSLLLLSASGNLHDYQRTIAMFNRFQNNSLGVTKIDETAHFGPCLTALMDLQKPVEIFGTGTGIPTDLEPATGRRIVEILTRRAH